MVLRRGDAGNRWTSTTSTAPLAARRVSWTAAPGLGGSLDGDAQRSNLPRAAFPPTVGSSLTNRLRVVDGVRRHPEVAGEAQHRLMKGNTR